MPNNPSPQGVDDALSEALERDAERRLNEAEPDDNYLVWLAEQQLAKQSEGELEDRQELLDALNTVRLDFRHVGPRRRVEENSPEPKRQVDISKSIRATDLLRLNLPALKWVVPDLIPEGTTLLAAPPKIGKSSLVYQMCVEIACGGSLLGRKVSRGSVLYLALEDGPRRGQTKIRAALQGRELPDRMEVWWNAPPIGEGLESALEDWIARTPDPVLIAIDTLERVRPDSDPRANAYRTDVHHLAALQNLFRDTPVGLLIVHHARKATDDDFVRAVSGTYGLTGTTDTNMTITRRRHDMYAVIEASGRDVAEVELPVAFSEGLWRVAPEALAATSDERLEVFDVIRHHGPIWPKAVAVRLGRATEAGRVGVQQMMTKLTAEGVIERVKNGYRVSGRVSAYSDYSAGEN